MRRKLIVLVLHLCVIVSARSDLKCGSSTTEGVCQCNIEIDRITSIPFTKAVCQYIGLEEFHMINSTELWNSLDLSHNDMKQLITAVNISREVGEAMLILKLSHNFIENVKDNFFTPFPNLRSLDLSHNKLRTLQSDNVDKLGKLEFLDLSFNEISFLPGRIFAHFQNLNTLNFSYNPLYNILQSPTAIMDNLAINENIQHLSMDNVGVRRIHGKCWNKFKNIIFLSISDNSISEIPQTSSTLEYLDISSTNVTELSENYLKYPLLKILKMSRMENLTTIAQYAWKHLESLEELTLSDSLKIEEFNDLSLNREKISRRLKKLNLARNNIRTLNESIKFILQETQSIDISFNPWNCDCRLLGILKDISIKPKFDMRCASPNRLINKKVISLKPNDIQNCYPEIYGKKSHQTALLILILLIFALIIVVTYLCLYSPSWAIRINRTNV